MQQPHFCSNLVAICKPIALHNFFESISLAMHHHASAVYCANNALQRRAFMQNLLDTLSWKKMKFEAINSRRARGRS
jgi:hypothetical protein